MNLIPPSKRAKRARFGDLSVESPLPFAGVSYPIILRKGQRREPQILPNLATWDPRLWWLAGFAAVVVTVLLGH